MKILLKEVGRPWREAEIENTLEAMQDAVGGYIETCTIAADLVIIYNEEGRLRRLPYNTRIIGTDFVGTIFACGVSGDEFADVPITINKWLRYWTGSPCSGCEEKESGCATHCIARHQWEGGRD